MHNECSCASNNRLRGSRCRIIRSAKKLGTDDELVKASSR